MSSDFDFLDYEASIVKDWPEEIQSLVDKGVVKVTYDENDNEIFSLTELGRSVFNELDLRLN